MELNYKGLQDRTAWEKAGVGLRGFDWEKMCRTTENTPVWVHFGAGNIFRGFIADLQQTLLEDGSETSGIVAADTFDFDIIDKIYTPYDNMTLMVGLKPDGSTDKKVIASIARGLRADSKDSSQWNELKKIFVNPALQMVSFTITEKGYSLRTMTGEISSIALKDMEEGPAAPVHAMGVAAALLYERYKAGGAPVAMVSMDNCSHNGEKLKAGVAEITNAWVEKGLVEKEFLAYLEDEERVAFPWSMIDKITPRPAKEIEEQLENLGIKDMAPVITGKNTYIAPFVNAEIPQYLVIEDRFPNGRPALEKAGVYMTDRDTVNMTERMKVTTCLNPLHTALAVYGCLLGYKSIAEEMKDKDLVALIENIGYKEGMPVVTDPGIIRPMDFIKEVVKERLPNPFIPDMPQRIATDTSQKVSIRFGETIKSYMARPDMDASGLTYIPLALAGWLRYLLKVDDAGNEMPVSPDPMLEQLDQALAGIQAGNPDSLKDQLKPVLENEGVFGVNLYEAGLGEKIEEMVRKMLAGPRAVRKTLREYL